MVHSSGIFAGSAAAARGMVEGDMANGAVGRFSKTIFIASDGRHPFLEEAALKGAAGAELGLVILQYGTGSKAKGPRCYTVAVLDDGVQVVEHDCALWIGDHGRAVLVPRGKGVDGWFEMTYRGLVRRAGRPAPSLAGGMIKAANRLVMLSKSCRTDGCLGVAVIDAAVIA